MLEGVLDYAASPNQTLLASGHNAKFHSVALGVARPLHVLRRVINDVATFSPRFLKPGSFTEDLLA